MSEFLAAPFKYPWKGAPWWRKILRYIYRRAHNTGAGVVVYFRVKNRPMTLLLHRSEPWNDWTFPKGSLEPRETDVKKAALREGSEETGLSLKIEKKLGINNYAFFKDDAFELTYRSIHYFLARAKDQKVNLTKNPDKDEIKTFDDLRWVSFPEARKMVKHQTERDFLLAAENSFKDN